MNVKLFLLHGDWSVGAIVLCVASSVAAQSNGISLADAIDGATKNDLQVRSMQSQLEAAQEKVAQAIARSRPQLQYTRLGTHTKRHDMDSAFRNRDYENQQWGLELQWPVYRRENQVVLDQAQLEVAQAQERLKLARIEILIKATKSYIEVLKAARQWAFADLQLHHAQLRWQQQKMQHQRGVLSEFESMDSQAKHLYAQSQLIQIQNDFIGKRLELQRLLGVPFVEALMGLPQTTSLENLASAVRGHWRSCLGDTLDEHPSVVIGRIGLQLNDNDLARSSAEFFPSLDFTLGQVGIDQTGNTYSAFPTKYRENAVTLKLTIPIYNGGASLSRREEALALAKRARATLDSAIAQTETSHQQGVFVLDNLIAIDKIQAPARRIAESALARLELAVSGGIRSTLDVLPAREELRKRMLEHEHIRYDAVYEIVKLLGLCGAIDAANISLLSNEMSQPVQLNQIAAQGADLQGLSLSSVRGVVGVSGN